MVWGNWGDGSERRQNTRGVSRFRRMSEKANEVLKKERVFVPSTEIMLIHPIVLACRICLAETLRETSRQTMSR